MIILLHQFSPYSISLEYANNENIIVIVPKSQKERYENYPKELPRIHYIEDFTFYDVLCEVKKISENYKIEKVYTLNEDIVEWAALISDYLLNPYSELVKSLLFTNKYYMRSFLKGIVKQPYFRLLKSYQDLEIFWSNTKGDKAIIKPLVGMASEKIILIDRTDKTIENNFYKYNMKYLIEEYIDIDYMVTGDGYSIGKDIVKFVSHEYGKPLLKSLNSDKKEYIIRTNINYNSNKPIIDNLMKECKKILEVFVLDESVNPFHFEWFYDYKNDEYYFCEVAKRFGGASIPFLANYAFNIDLPYEFWVSFIRKGDDIFEKTNKNQIIYPQKIAVSYSVGFKGGAKILKMIDKKELEWTKNSWIFAKENQELKESNTISDLIGIIEIICEDEADYNNKLEKIRNIMEGIQYE